ncbi:MAG: hypothetical protein OXC81_02350 [Betaproteobacteria bacterium]|nr:hypothetical protein [Betaproteobacteria bacterium]
MQAKIGKLTADREKLTRIIKRGTATLELQQASSLRDITGIASKVARQIPVLIKWLLGIGLLIYAAGAALIWKSCIPETQELCAAYALQGQYLSIVALSAIAIIVSSCVIGARGLIAFLLKRPPLSSQNPQT